jgi:hypothetical protein
MKYAETHSFNAWVFRVSYRKIIRRLLGLRACMFAEHTHGMDEIVRYESIENDLNEVFNRVGIAWKGNLPKINRTDERTERDYRSFYSQPAELAVAFANSYDLKTYGY